MKRFARIIACTDFSEVGNRAVETAFGLAHGGGATIYLTHVMDPPPMPNPMYAHYASLNSWAPGKLEQATAKATEALEELVPEEAKRTGVSIVYQTPQGAPAVEILRLAKESDAEVVVIGTHGRTGFQQFLLGSVAERVVRKADCTVMVIR